MQDAHSGRVFSARCSRCSSALAATALHEVFCDQRIKRAKSLRIRKLIFRNDSLDIVRLALDAVSKTSICLNGHKLNDGVRHWWISRGSSLWTLGLVANVFIQLIGI
jgi:hypothetical protein